MVRRTWQGAGQDSGMDWREMAESRAPAGAERGLVGATVARTPHARPRKSRVAAGFRGWSLGSVRQPMHITAFSRTFSQSDAPRTRSSLAVTAAPASKQGGSLRYEM